MKLRLVIEKKKMLLYCPNGSIMKADEGVLARLLTEFETPSVFLGEDGYWNVSCPDMDKAKGQTLAYVDDMFNLVVSNQKAFESFKSPASYISASEYAELHQKPHSLITRLCSQNRIPGAQKTRAGWLIPRDAPYPPRKEREVKK